MFTGLIETCGGLRRVEPRGPGVRLTLGAPAAMVAQLTLGESVAVDGACLTVIRWADDWFEVGVRAEDEETLAFECAGAVRSLRKKIGLPEGLAAAGVSEEVLPKLAERALADPCHQLNPRPCTAEDMLALYRASM